MDVKQKKKIIVEYKDLLQFYFKTGRRESDIDDKHRVIHIKITRLRH